MNDFGPEDLMPWQDMTRRIKELESRIKTLEDALVGMQRHNEHIMDVLRRRDARLTELEEKVATFEHAFDLLQEVIGVHASILGEHDGTKEMSVSDH